MQAARRRPTRAGRPTPRGRRRRSRAAAGSVERRHPQLGPVPGHVRVVPAGQGEPAAVRADPREGVEVAPPREHGRLVGPVERQGDDLVLGFAARRATSRTQTTVRPSGASRSRRSAGRRALGLGRDRDRLLAEPLPVEPLVGEVDEEDEVAATSVQAPPPYSWTRVRTLAPGGVTSSGSPPAARRISATRPPSAGRPSAHQTAPSAASCGAASRRPAAATTVGRRSASARTRRGRSSGIARSLGPSVADLVRPIGRLTQQSTGDRASVDCRADDQHLRSPPRVP